MLVFVHGGGWKEEDKINFGKAGSAIPYLQELGMVVVAVNFRLWPEFDYAVQTCDIANAIKWVHDHIAEHGGDPKSVSLMGHSSGAHLASLIGIDASYLQAYGLTPAYLRSTILIDTVTYDMPRALETAPSLGYPESVDALQYIFSKRPEVHLDASTVTHAKAGLSYAPFLIISAGDKGGVQQQLTKDQANVLAKSLKSVGVDAAAHHVQNESHTSLVQKLGESSHEPTRLIGEFLKKHGI